MFRFVFFPLLAVVLFPSARGAGADPGSGSPPLTYELMINGESFLVEANRQQRLESRQSPGVTYDVALRIAMTQPVKLNTLRFEYDWPAEVEDDRRQPQRTVRIRHELGFTMLITDLGRPVEEAGEDEALKIVSESVVEGLRGSGMEHIQVGDSHTLPFPAAAGRGVVIHCRGGQGYDQTCLVYLLRGKGFAASCVVQYLDAEVETVLPRVRKTFNSIRPIP